ncbi:MAG TPA: ATP-binding cassette domain-containing protein [Casimicrobiaceae bacterium]|nr:ATP-binding cassette domain-containing protein [Casimicrobiaceae bacterium]
MFEIASVEHRYGGTRVLSVPSWSARAGEAWLLAGPSGSGKSTLLNILAGLTTPSAGRVIVAGQDVVALRPSARDRWRGEHVGIVPQRLHLIAAVSVADNLRIACTMAGLRVDEPRIRALLEAVHVADLAQRLPRQLSQGQAQRVAIARAVVNRPALVLADEPTANLDDVHAAAALELLRAQALETGATLVVASHDARVRPLLPHAYALPARAPALAA